jgi:hypothetical protein
MKQMKTVVAGALMAASMAGMSMAQGTAAPAATPPAAPKTWVDSITLKGDLRYRYESISDDSKLDANKDTYTRQRDRIRARLGAEAKVNDNAKVGVELSTGQSDPVSGNNTIGDGFAKKDMKLNLAYVDYSFFGDNPNEVHAIFGKMKNPFITMNDDLVWDPDATPEGVACKGLLGLADGKVSLLANGGYLWIQERADKPDAMLYAGQAAVKLQFVDELALTLGGSYYGFQNLQGSDVMDWEMKNSSYGNSTTKGTIVGAVTNKAWATDFTPVVLFAQLDAWLGRVPVAVFGQGSSNGDADENKKAQMFGFSIGKAKNPKTAECGYSYAKVEQDAVLGCLTDSDRWGGGADGKGHKMYAKYQLMKNLQVGATYFVDEKTISDSAKTKDYDRLQVDLVATF